VHGLGGAGKTQMAIESAPPYAADHDLVWSVPAEHRLAIPGRPAALALRLGLPATLARVSVPSGPRRLRRSGRPMIPAQVASPSRSWLAAVWAVGFWCFG
jgi:hypothetical protein